MTKHRLRSRATPFNNRNVADLEAEAMGVRVVKVGDRYRVFEDGVEIGRLWRSVVGAWGYTTSDGHDGFIYLRQRSARNALIKRHLKRAGRATGPG